MQRIIKMQKYFVLTICLVAVIAGAGTPAWHVNTRPSASQFKSPDQGRSTRELGFFLFILNPEL